MSANITALLYLASGILFILALRGLSSPATSRGGNRYGMIGMAVAVATTLLVQAPSFTSLVWIVIGVGIGGAIGATVAQRIAMTAMPELVAGFHALVGLAAGTAEGAQGVLVYIAIYVTMTLGSFAVILTMKRHGQHVENISDLAGLSRHAGRGQRGTPRERSGRSGPRQLSRRVVRAYDRPRPPALAAPRHLAGAERQSRRPDPRL